MPARSAKPKLEEIFLRKKPVHLLVSLLGSKKYVSVVAKEIDCTYSHVVKLLNELKKYGLIEFEKEGRVKYLTLTQEGTEVAKLFESLLRRFSKIRIKED